MVRSPPLSVWCSSTEAPVTGNPAAVLTAPRRLADVDWPCAWTAGKSAKNASANQIGAMADREHTIFILANSPAEAFFK